MFIQLTKDFRGIHIPFDIENIFDTENILILKIFNI